MLTELTIKDLGLVADAQLQLSRGFNVITGETGAGKSTLLNALRLLSGGRSDASLVRAGAPKAVVDAVWEPSSKLIAELQDREVNFDGGELFVGRWIQNDGKSRLSVGGRPVANSYMVDLAELLVEIHGQADQLKLRDTDIQRELLDSVGGQALADALDDYKKAYGSWTTLKKKLQELQDNSGRREIELQYNRSLVKRFEELDPQEGELDTLIAEIEKLAHLEDISEGIHDATNILLPEDVDSPYSLIAQAISILSKLGKYDDELEKIASAIDDALKGLEPTIDELEAYANSIDLDSLSRLREFEDRVTDLKIFAKPFGGDLDKAIEACLKAQEDLAEAEELVDLEAIQEELNSLKEILTAKAESLREIRVDVAEKLNKAVNVELSGLAMKGVEFVAQLTERTPTVHGADNVEFMVETKGKNRRPITKAASGGELSRIMLALELVTAANSEGPSTIVFDEIDSGVGGSTAIEIGRRLARLSKTHQVILVSHLPQVAAWADTHYVLSKEETNDGVTTELESVSEEARVKEIARMLSGLSDSDTGLAHARELLATADGEKISF
jgi:DNA repair protein RecN (Recombination protein N)